MHLSELRLINTNMLQVGGQTYRCTIGREGLAEINEKREGDLKTPRGRFPLRCCYYRPDKITPPANTGLKLIPLSPTDGWCDDATHPLYNQYVKLPFDGRHEKLWRDDDVYDLIIPLGYNDGGEGPIIPGNGSAIFMHLMRADGVGTEGCIALKKEDLISFLPNINAQTIISI